MKNETIDFVDLVESLLDKYKDIKKDKESFGAGGISGLNIGVHLIQHGIVTFSPRMCKLLADCDDSLTPLTESLAKVNARISRRSAVYTHLYFKQELRHSIFMKAYQDGVYFGLHYVSLAYKMFVEKKCSNAAINVLLPRYIERRKKAMQMIIKEVADAN